MEPAEVILCVQQSWHSHVPLKENWPSCTLFLLESPRDQNSLSSSKGAQTINQYPTAFRKWESLKEEDLIGLFAFPLPIHLALCKVSERQIVFYLSHAAVLNCSNACAQAAPRQGIPSLCMGSRTVDQVPSSPYGNTLWHEASYRVARDWVTFPGQAKWYPHNDTCSVNRTLGVARCSWRWILEVPDILDPVGIGRTLTCSRRLFCHYCTKLFMGLNLQVLTELFLSVYGKVTPILAAYLVLQGLSGLYMHFGAYGYKQSMCNWRLGLAKALMSLLYLGSSEFSGILLDQYNLDVPSAAQVSGMLWLLLRPFLLTQAPMTGPFLWEGSGDPRATMGPSVAFNAAWGALGGVGWAEGRHISRSSKHSSTWQYYFVLGSSISPLQHVFACEPRRTPSRAERSGALVEGGW